MNDIFDKIISGEIPSYKVLETDTAMAFLDISQVTKGHTLLVPKKDLENIYEYSDIDVADVLKYLPVISRAIKKGLRGVIGVNIISNNEPGAGQAVLHSHFHIIPRYLNDGFNGLNDGIDNSNLYTPDDYQKIADTIKKGIDEDV
jgi:histidine triad (HIT) family protein